jgi:CXXC-20-CXXC protein
VSIQKCITCSEPFTWRKVRKSLCAWYIPVKCTKCGTEHYPTLATKIVIAFLFSLPVYAVIKIELLLRNTVKSLGFITFILYFSIVYILTWLLPIFGRFNNRDSGDHLNSEENSHQ